MSTIVLTCPTCNSRYLSDPLRKETCPNCQKIKQSLEKEKHVKPKTFTCLECNQTFPTPRIRKYCSNCSPIVRKRQIRKYQKKLALQHNLLPVTCRDCGVSFVKSNIFHHKICPNCLQVKREARKLRASEKAKLKWRLTHPTKLQEHTI